MTTTTTTTSTPTLRQLLLVLILAPYASCQEVKVEEVATTYVEVSWMKVDQWFGVGEFTVNLTNDATKSCSEIVVCHTPTCVFSTLACGELPSCTLTNLTVTGDNYQANTVYTTTAPEPVTNLSLWKDMGLNAAWVNPDMFSSPCYEYTVAQLSFNGETTTVNLEEEEEETTFLMCGVAGYGKVKVWTHGVDGDSQRQLQSFGYQGSDVVPPIDKLNCSVLSCSSVLLEWDYNPICPGATVFLAGIKYHETTVDLSVRNLTLTDLLLDEYYTACVRVGDEDGQPLSERYCISCKTPVEIVHTLEVVGIDSNKIRASWEEPLCQKNPELRYEVTISRYEDYVQESATTEDTSYTFDSCSTLTTYYVCVTVDRPSYQDDLCDLAKTLPRAPYYVVVEVVSGDNLEVNWNNQDRASTCKVSWGPNLQYSDYTKGETYVIPGYNSTEAVGDVCVAVIAEDLTSVNTCMTNTPEQGGDDGSSDEGLIVGMVLFGALIVAVVVVLLGIAIQGPRRRRKQQQQQQQQYPSTQELTTRH